jgi:hypothetical protein
MSTPKTAREALEQCQLLWRNVLETDNLNKYAAAKEELGYIPRYGCPACEYAISVSSDAYGMCDHCPVDAWRAQADAKAKAPCAYPGSPYHDWCCSGTDKARGDAALGILRLVRASLKNLED